MPGLRWPLVVASALVTVWVARPASAHLMDDQQGTLNIVGQRGYLVLSLPVSALTGVDDDRDGRLSGAELQRHAAPIERDLRGRVRVSEGDVAVPLDGVLLQLSPDEQHRDTAATHLVMLAVAMFPRPPERPRLALQVFGRLPAERSFRIVASRRDAAGGLQERVLRFTPAAPRQDLFASKAPQR